MSKEIFNIDAKVKAAASIYFDRACKLSTLADQSRHAGDNDIADYLARCAKREDQTGHKIIATWQRFVFLIGA